MKRRPLHQPGCSRCDTPEDLRMIGDAVLCGNCRTCRHGYTYFSEPDRDSVCRLCLRELFTEKTFGGPRIDDIRKYAKMGECYGLSVSELRGNCAADEEQIWQLMAERYSERDRQQTLSIKAAFENLGKDSATVSDTPASASEQSGTSPCPLPHHLVRGRTW